jgi:hypothetical protein
MEAVR